MQPRPRHNIRPYKRRTVIHVIRCRVRRQTRNINQNVHIVTNRRHRPNRCRRRIHRRRIRPIRLTSTSHIRNPILILLIARSRHISPRHRSRRGSNLKPIPAINTPLHHRRHSTTRPVQYLLRIRHPRNRQPRRLHRNHRRRKRRRDRTTTDRAVIVLPMRRHTNRCRPRKRVRRRPHMQQRIITEIIPSTRPRIAGSARRCTQRPIHRVRSPITTPRQLLHIHRHRQRSHIQRNIRGRGHIQPQTILTIR